MAGKQNEFLIRCLSTDNILMIKPVPFSTQLFSLHIISPSRAAQFGKVKSFRY